MRCSSLRRAGGWILAVAVLLTAGCVDPGAAEVNDLYRLQQAMLARSPQPRPAGPLGGMRPTNPTVPLLEVRDDPETGREAVYLSLHEVILRTLANNTDIAIVAYEPAISRQQVIQAAAAFDYILFGSAGYTSTDSAQDYRWGLLPEFLPAITKRRDLSAGVRQRTVTGAEWAFTSSFVRSWDDGGVDRLRRWYLGEMDLSVTQPLLRNAWPEVNLADLRIARLNHRISLSQFREQVEQTLVEAITAYYRLIQARADRDIALRLLAVTQETYQRVEQRKELDATAAEIQQSLASVKTREAILLAAEKSLTDARDNLARILSDERLNVLEDYEIIPVTELTAAPVEIDPTDQLLTAVRLNPQLEQLRLAIDQDQIRVRVAKNQTLPSLDLSAGVTLQGASRVERDIVWDDLMSGKFLGYRASLTLEYPIGNRQRIAALAESRLRRFQDMTRLQNASDLIAQQVQERIRQIETRYAQLRARRESWEANKAWLEALNILETERGALTPEFLNLKLQAQAAVATSESDVIAATVDYNVAQLDLARVTGAVLELNRVKLAMPVAAHPVSPADYRRQPGEKPE